VNAPPSSGFIIPEPETGTALTTSFGFTAAQWVDDAEDLPLTYVFAYIIGNVTNLDEVPSSEVRVRVLTCVWGWHVRTNASN
jgi:hypothetical protein